MTRAMDPEVADAIWAAIEPILPVPDDGAGSPTTIRLVMLDRLGNITDPDGHELSFAAPL